MVLRAERDRWGKALCPLLGLLAAQQVQEGARGAPGPDTRGQAQGRGILGPPQSAGPEVFPLVLQQACMECQGVQDPKCVPAWSRQLCGAAAAGGQPLAKQKEEIIWGFDGQENKPG